MAQTTHTSARGRAIDMNALRLKNEHVRAVGNMNVNARGDLIDADNKPIDTRNASVNRQYNKQINNVTDEEVVTPQTKNNQVNDSPKDQPVAETVEGLETSDELDPTVIQDIPEPPEDFDDDFTKVDIDDDKPLTGIQAALAKAKQKGK